MIEKKIFIGLTLLLFASAAMITPVVLPFFTLEKPDAIKIDLTATGDLEDYAKNLQSRAGRNMKRLQTARVFSDYFVLSFSTFIMSLSGLFFLATYKIIYKKHLNERQSTHLKQ